MNNWRTTLIALMTGVASLLAQYGIVLTPETQMAIVVLGVVLIGVLSKDAGNTTLTGDEK